jgi:hypothetical protein
MLYDPASPLITVGGMGLMIVGRKWHGCVFYAISKFGVYFSYLRYRA